MIAATVVNTNHNTCPDDRDDIRLALQATILWGPILILAAIGVRGDKKCNDGTAFRVADR